MLWRSCYLQVTSKLLLNDMSRSAFWSVAWLRKGGRRGGHERKARKERQEKGERKEGRNKGRREGGRDSTVSRAGLGPTNAGDTVSNDAHNEEDREGSRNKMKHSVLSLQV